MLKQIVLLESIDHLEDLSPAEFVQTVETIKNRIVTEKLDGANLWFGLDANGFYTSREAKTPTRGRFYDVDDYGSPTPNSNAFRAAHAALEKVQGIIKQHLQEGDAVEIEVLFGRQPNTVVYGLGDKNFIVILRGIADTPDERVNKLAAALKGKHVDAESTIVSSGDGLTLRSDDVVMKWSFTNVAPIPAKKINTDAVMSLLDDMKKFLADKNSIVPGSSNQDVLELSLGSVKKDARAAVKTEKGRLEAQLMHDFKGPIKELLLSKFVRKIKPFLQSADLHPSEKDIGVEGVVIRDPVTDNQVKIVDKQVFTELNQFNSSVRNEISGLVISLDPNQSLKNRGGIYGEAKIRIAAFLGIPDLARSSGTSAVVKSLKAANAEDAAEKLGAAFKMSDLRSAKTKIAAILKSAKDDIAAKLDEFKRDPDKSTTLSSGKQVSMSPEIIKKTLTSIASTNKEIDALIDAVGSSSSPAELATALYGRTFDSVFKGGATMKESYSLIKAISEDGEGAVSAAAVGGEGGGGGDATTAGAIAPMPFKLFGSKPVVRRMRNYNPEKKFSKMKKTIQNLLSKINEDESKIDALSNAADVDDSIHAKNDVEFKKLRNTVGVSDTVSQVDVSNYLKKAHEINDEVDTVIFGMELDDGSVVKVYVNAAEASKFEEALSQMLGKEDDAEKVIDALATSFDIVDVVWPEVKQPEPEETDIIDAQKEKEEEEEEAQSKKQDQEEKEATSKDDTESSEAESEEDIHLGVENPDEDESEEKPNKDTKENAMASISQIFKQKLLKEKTEVDHEEHDADAFVAATKEKYGHQIETLMHAFPRPADKAIIAIMLNLGVPPATLNAVKKDLRDSIQPASSMYRGNALFKTFANKLFAALSASGQSVTEDEDESLLDKRLNSKYQHVIYHILGALGMPGYVEEVRPSLLTAGIKHSAKVALKDMSVRRALNGLASILGVSDKTRHLMEPPTPEQMAKITEQDEQPVVNVPKGTDERVEEVMGEIISMLLHLDLDPNKQKSIAAQLLMPNSHRALTKISANSQLMRLLTQLNTKLSVAKVGVQESVAAASKFVTLDLGDSLEIKVHEDEAQKLFHAIHLEQSCSVLNKSGKRLSFNRQHDGSYQIKEGQHPLANIPADKVAELKLKLID